MVAVTVTWKCRIYSNKRWSAYLIFHATSVELLQGRPLLEGGAYLNIVQDNFTFSIFFYSMVHFLSVNFPMDWY